MVRYHVPSVSSSLRLERRCPHCGRPNGRIHSKITWRRLSGPKVETIAQRRMKCPFCKTTWTIRGFKSWDQALAPPYLSRHLRGLNAVSDLRMVI
ncbi:MAG: hypothetical protein JSU94_16175 [Phycisphaerales bacterium]|nr:MAG: hypothetical protein JSU94_16175 [Phycisphaerales bacterium]